MIKRKKLGQHFLNSDLIAHRIISEAEITKEDVVYELGIGLGKLTPLLCEKAKKVVSIDIDKYLVQNAKSQFSNFDNLILKHGDGFKNNIPFSIFISNLPYSRSKDAIEWLAQTSFSHGIIMVQKEFAEKLLTTSPHKRKSVTIIANHAFEIKKISKIGKDNFTPAPKIDSVILKISKKNAMQKDLIHTINNIFSFRRKTVKNILKQFNIASEDTDRLEDLSGDQVISLGNQIVKH